MKPLHSARNSHEVTTFPLIKNIHRKSLHTPEHTSSHASLKHFKKEKIKTEPFSNLNQMLCFSILSDDAAGIRQALYKGADVNHRECTYCLKY